MLGFGWFFLGAPSYGKFHPGFGAGRWRLDLRRRDDPDHGGAEGALHGGGLWQELCKDQWPDKAHAGPQLLNTLE